MKATLTTRAPKFHSSHRKENAGLHKSYSALVVAKDTGRIFAVCEARIYWPASTAYACLWTHAPAPDGKGEGIYTSGSGRAGGGGYCKQSAAVGEAISNAGFDLSQSIDGVGEEAIRNALVAVAEACGYPGAQIFETHP